MTDEIDFHPPFAPKVFDLQFMTELEMRPYCGPIFFARPLEAQSILNVTNQGSYGLVYTGKRRLLVTCRHVWTDFDKARSIDPELQLFLCPYPGTSIFSLGAIRPIDEDKELDLATFDIEPFLDQLGESTFWHLYYSSLPRVKKLEPVAFIGFPGRIEASTSLGIKFNRVPFVTFAYDVTERQIMSDMSRMFTYSKEPRDTVPARDRGGISGAPCFVVRPNLGIELVGFATQEALELLRFSLASFINPDGTIKRP